MDRLPPEPAEARALLEDHYGRPEAAPITPHQRVAMVLRHEEPDRVPFDFWAVPEVWATLRRYLDTDDDGDVLRLLGVDCRWVRPDYVGPAPIVQEDGSYYDAFGTHRRSVSNEFCTYEEYASHPLADVQTVAEVESWLGWPPTDAVLIKREFGDRLSFYGAVDIQQALPRGTPQEVSAEVQERCRVLGQGGGYICASAHYVQADTPLENILAMYTAPWELPPV